MSSVAPAPRFTRLLAGVVLARHQWQRLLVVLTLVICYLAITPTPPQEASFGWDKANHTLAFLALTLAGCLGFRGARRGTLWVLLGVFGLGCAIELVQLFVPGRSCEWQDLLADSAGIGLGLAVALAVLRLVNARR
jgi:VanZ family protein